MVGNTDELDNAYVLIAKLGDVIASIAADRDRNKAALTARTQQLGVACLKHDLTHALYCGHCALEMKGLLLAVLDSDMAQREEDEGQKSELLESIRKALA